MGGWIGIGLFLFSLLIEITPIKINPLSWLGRVINKDLVQKLNKIDNKLDDHIVKSYRNDILRFQEKLLFCPDKTFTREAWNQVLDSCDKYDAYIKDNHISNGQVTEAMKYIKASYQEVLMNRKFTDLSVKGESA